MVKDRGTDIKSVLISRNNGISAVKHKLGALLNALFNPVENRCSMFGGDNRTEL